LPIQYTIHYIQTNNLNHSIDATSNGIDTSFHQQTHNINKMRSTKSSAMMPSIFSLLALPAILSLAINTLAQQQDELCSCGPISYTFQLNFQNDCDTNDLQSLGGIGNTICTIVEEEDGGDGNPLIGDLINGSGGGSNSSNGGGTEMTLEEMLADIPWINRKKIIKNKIRQEGGNGNRNNQRDRPRKNRLKKPQQSVNNNDDEDVRRLQTTSATALRPFKQQSNSSPLTRQSSPLTPVTITSIQFIEINPENTVINISDDLDPTNLVNGDTFSVTSIAELLATDLVLEDQLELLPQTAVLFMVGVNANGDVVRGRFVWRYNLGCGMNQGTMVGGDEFGWVKFQEVDPAVATFCPANILNPTKSPVNETPTTNPTGGDFTIVPTKLETFPPTNSPIGVDTAFPTYGIVPTSSPIGVDMPAPSTRNPVTRKPTTKPVEEGSPTVR
jgi:hypothetical protein